MEEYIKSIKAYLYDRTTSPLFGTFVVSWVGWNYRFLVVLFSSQTVDVKFKYFSDIAFPSYHSYLFTGFLFPLVTASLIILIYPFPAKWAYTYARWRQNILKQERQRLDLEEPLTEEDKKKLQANIATQQMEHDKKVAGYIAKIENLEALVEELRGKPDNVVTVSTTKEEDDPNSKKFEEFAKYRDSGELDQFIANQHMILTYENFQPHEVDGSDTAIAFGLLEKEVETGRAIVHVKLSEKGREFFEWLILNKK